MENLYETLQCAPTASKDELRRAYTRLARRHHPDKKAQRESAINNPVSDSGLSNHPLDSQPTIRIKPSNLHGPSSPKPSDNNFPSPFEPLELKNAETELDQRTPFPLNGSDKKYDSVLDSNCDFVKIDKAWKILGNDDLRVQYDIMWKDRCLMQEHPVQETVPYDDFDSNVDENVFLYPCRCGGEFVLSELERQLLCDFVCCDTCSLIIKISYD